MPLLKGCEKGKQEVRGKISKMLHVREVPRLVWFSDWFLIDDLLFRLRTDIELNC